MFRESRTAIARAMMVFCGAAVLLAGCQDQRNEFNPIRVLCPGDFDPVTNQCNIPTGRMPTR